jgi:hypothetical protein
MLHRGQDCAIELRLSAEVARDPRGEGERLRARRLVGPTLRASIGAAVHPAEEVQNLEPVLPLVQGISNTRFCDGQGWAS